MDQIRYQVKSLTRSDYQTWDIFSGAKQWQLLLKDCTHESEEWRRESREWRILISSAVLGAIFLFCLYLGGVVLVISGVFGGDGDGDGDGDGVVVVGGGGGGGGDGGVRIGVGGGRGGSEVSVHLIRRWECLEVKKMKDSKDVFPGCSSVLPYYVRNNKFLLEPRLVPNPKDNSIFLKLMSSKFKLARLNEASNVFEWMIRLKVPPKAAAHNGVLTDNFCKVGMASRMLKNVTLLNPQSSPWSAYSPMKHGQNEKAVELYSQLRKNVLEKKGERKHRDLVAMIMEAYH